MAEQRPADSDGFVILTLRAFEEDGQFVSECVELQTASQGDTLDEAIANAQEATQLYLDAISELGERDRVFRERRLTVIERVPNKIHLNPEHSLD